MADGLLLNDGTTVDGTFLRGNSRQITFVEQRGSRTRDFPIRDVKTVYFGDAWRAGGSRLPRNPRNLPPAAGRSGSEIAQKYASLGGEGGLLGPAFAEEQATANGRGRLRHYRDATIYWSPETGAFEVHGAIRQKYTQIGAAEGAFGFPKSDEMDAADGGKYNHFENGSIYYHPQTGAQAIFGGIRDKWAALGWERSSLGYPQDGEQATADGQGRFVNFQNGLLYWHPQHGGHAVQGRILEEWQRQGAERSPLGYPTGDEQIAGRGRRQEFQNGSLVLSPQGAVRVERR